MANYPADKSGSKFGFNLKNVNKEGNPQGTFDKLGDGVGGGVMGMAGEAVSNIGKQNMGYGVSYKGTGAMAAGTGLKGAGAGYEIGKNFGAPGAVIGAAAGLVGGTVAGAIKGKRLKEEAIGTFNQKQGEAITDISRTSRKKYGTLQGYKGASYAKGGKMDIGKSMGGSSGKSVILGGRLHSEGGNLIVHAKTKKPLAETEREELFLTDKHTVQVEEIIKKYDSKQSDAVLEELGQVVQHILLNETIDNSGRFSD
jgi:hypothetical protein